MELLLYLCNIAMDDCQDGVTNNCTDICSRDRNGVHVCDCREGFSLEADRETCTGESKHQILYMKLIHIIIIDSELATNIYRYLQS